MSLISAHRPGIKSYGRKHELWRWGGGAVARNTCRLRVRRTHTDASLCGDGREEVRAISRSSWVREQCMFRKHAAESNEETVSKQDGRREPKPEIVLWLHVCAVACGYPRWHTWMRARTYTGPCPDSLVQLLTRLQTRWRVYLLLKSFGNHLWKGSPQSLLTFGEGR